MGAIIRIEDKHIVLVGMMGTGKSTVGRSLAKRTGRPFIDTDHAIESREACTVAHIFKARGEDYFRDVESAVIREAVERPPSVIATGGGALLRTENQRALKQRGIMVWLKADVEQILQRTARRRKTRPLLKAEDPRDHARQLLAERMPAYAQADWSIDTTGRGVDEVACLIAEHFDMAGES